MRPRLADPAHGRGAGEEDMLKRFICWLTNHDWNWEEMRKPENIFKLVSGDFPCVRCGFMWRDHRPDLVPKERRIP